MRLALRIIGGLLILAGITVVIVAAVGIRPALDAIGSVATTGSSLSNVTLQLTGKVNESLRTGEDALRQTERSIVVSGAAWTQVSQRMPHIADTAQSLAETCKTTGGKLHEVGTTLEGFRVPVDMKMENYSIFGKDFAIRPTLIYGNPFLGICKQLHVMGDQAWYMKGHMVVVADTANQLAPDRDPVAPSFASATRALQATSTTLSSVRTETMPAVIRLLEQVERGMHLVAAGMPYVFALVVFLGCGMGLCGVACVLLAQAVRPGCDAARPHGVPG